MPVPKPNPCYVILLEMNTAVAMDHHTLELLEFNKIRELLAGYAFSSPGKELVRQIEPSTEAEKIRADLALVSEMVDVLGLGQVPPLSGLHDVRLLARRAAIGSMLSADELLQVAETLAGTGAIYRYRTSLDARFQRLIELLTPIEDMGVIAKAITGCIDSRGHLLDMASTELARLRQQLAELEEKVQNQIKRLLRDPELRKILRYPNATVNGDHYVLPVAANHRHKLQGVIHRTSSTGETVFIEPAGIAHLSAERAVLKGEEDREIRRVLRRLSGDVGKVSRPLSFAIERMARLDLITAKARFSQDYAMYAPEMNTDGRLWLRQARHPLLEHLFRTEQEVGGELPEWRGGQEPESRADDLVDKPVAATTSPPRRVVPIDVRLGQPYKLLVITGPNTGGKTVTLKTTGLLSLMAQSGMHIPAAEGSALPVFQQILADIGDEQSLEQSLSTFSSHMSRISAILCAADDKSLVLLDELGAGTDPTEGAALGRAILDGLDQRGCRAMVTTHLGDLKTYAFNNENAENAAVEFDVETLRPTYHLRVGQFGMSNAIQIARRLKLPRDLLKRARRYLRRRQKRAPELAQLQRLRQDAEQARDAALVSQHEAERQREEYRQKLTSLERQAEEAAVLKELRAKLQPNDPVRVARFDKSGRLVRVDYKRNIAVVSVGLGQWEVPLEEVFPAEK
jgi:DNA mismatch repair protein MutS2